MIKAIIFDFGQTLADSAHGFRAAEKQAQMRIFADLKLESWEKFISTYRKVRRQFHTEYNFSRKALWQHLYNCFQRQPDPQFLEQCEHEYWQTAKAATTLFPETQQVLEKLASRYKIGLVTNTQVQGQLWNHRVNRFPQLQRLFEVIIVAGESGVPAKPDPAVFMLCLEKLAVNAAEAVFVGDDWNIDICGAMNAGIQPVWLRHHRVHRTWPQVKGSVPVVTNLEQLLDIDKVLSTISQQNPMVQ
jgi:putative hydrolase of the HAD superfamily